jgi:hypothetical protein
MDMKAKLTAALAAAALAALTAAGCYQSTGVTWYEAGLYKGTRDPLTGKLEDPELQRALEKRLRDVQTDR